VPVKAGRRPSRCALCGPRSGRSPRWRPIARSWSSART